MTDRQQKPTVRATDFRYVASDAIGFQFSDDIIKILFGMDDLNGTILEQSGVMLSHASGKLLGLMIQESIKRFEQRTGRTVPLSPDKIDEVMKIFDAAELAMVSPQNP